MLRLRKLLVTAAIATAAAVASTVALASHVVATPRDKMMMGTIDGGEDMMHNGVVLDPYNRQHGHVLPANPAHVNFWATLMDHQGSERLRVSFARGVHPSFDLTNPSGSDITVRGGIPPYSSPVPLSFECIHNNTNAPETAIMDVSFLDTPLADSVVFYFDKECTWPLLNIGMNENTASIWHLGKHVDWTYLAHPDDDSSRFYFWMDDSSTYEALTYSIRSIDYDQTVLSLTYDISEPVARKFKLGTPESSLLLQYTCHNNLPFSQTTIHVVLNIGWKAGEGRDVQFIWVKQCSASHTGNPRHGFDIGTQPGLGDVIKNGVVQHDWAALSSGVDKKVFYDLQKLTFYAFINETDIGMNPRIQDFSLSYYTDVKPGDLNAIYDIIATNITGQTARVGSYVEMGFQIVCKVAGTAITRVNLVMDHYGANAFFFEKTCTFPKLQIGTTENVANVVVDSKVVPWNYNEASKKTSTKFYLWVPHGDAVSQQHFLISHVNWDHSILSASVKIVGDNVARPLQMGTPEASITFMYQCYDTVKPGTLAAVNMTIDIGWQGEQLTWAWHKQCGEVPSPAPGGWSAFGIFAFTVFMLTLIGCLGGCMYNYFGPAAKRGLRVVPGHSVFASCYDKLVTPKAYTPQTSDYTYNAAEEKAGAGYQTDL